MVFFSRKTNPPARPTIDARLEYDVRAWIREQQIEDSARREREQRLAQARRESERLRIRMSEHEEKPNTKGL